MKNKPNRFKHMNKDNMIKVTISNSDHQFILEETYTEPDIFGVGIVNGDKITFQLSEIDIEYIQGFIAAKANTCDEPKKEKKLDSLLEQLDKLLE